MPVLNTLPWAEFLSSSFNQYGCFPRRGDAPLPYFKKISRDSLRAIWRKSLALTQGSCPREIGLEVHGDRKSSGGDAVLKTLKGETEELFGVFQDVRFSIISLRGREIAALNGDELDHLLSYFQERFLLKNGAFICVSGSPKSLTDQKWRTLSRHKITSLTLEMDGESQRWEDILNRISRIPGLEVDARMDLSGGVQSGDFSRDMVGILKLNPRRLYFHYPNCSGEDKDILTRLVERLALKAGYRRQDFGEEYLFLRPWEAGIIGYQRKLRDSVLSLGAGSMSHAFGAAWYYQSKERLDESEFFAIDWSFEEEMRAYALGALSQARKISLRAFADLFRNSLWDVSPLAETIHDFKHQGFLKIEGDDIVWKGDDEAAREAQLKKFLNPSIVKSLLKSEALALQNFSERFNRDPIEWKSHVARRIRNQETAVYYDAKPWKR